MTRSFDEAQAIKELTELARTVYPENTQPNTFQTGTLAAIIKIGATVLVENGTMASIAARESRENTMVLPENIFALASYNHTPIELGEPAFAQVVIAIPVSALRDLPSVRFHTSDPATFGDLDMVLRHDVVLDRTASVPKAFYDTVVPGPNARIKDPDVQIFENSIGGIRHISMIVEMVQAQRIVQRFEMLSDDVVRINTLDMDFQNQLASHSLFYDPSGSAGTRDTDLKQLETIKLLNSSIQSTAQDESKTAFINYIDENTIRFIFSPRRNNFRPRIGSAVIGLVYTTKGTKGNINQTPDIKLSSSELNQNVGIVSLSTFSGGIDRPSRLQTKVRAIEFGQHRDALDTDFDVNRTLQRQLETFNSDSYELSVKRYRDDILRRVWSVNVVLSGPDDLIVPSRTIDIQSTVKQMIDRGWMLKANTPAIYDAQTDSYRLADEFEELPTIPDHSDAIYTIPFLTRLSAEPFPRMVFLRTSINDTHQLRFRESSKNSIKTDILLGQLRITRDALRQSQYTLSVSAMQLDRSSDDIPYRVLLFFHSGNFTIGWREITEWNPSSGQFIGSLSTNDNYDPETFQFEITNLRSTQDGSEQSVFVDENLWVEVVLISTTDAESSQLPLDQDSSLFANRLVGDPVLFQRLMSAVDLNNFSVLSIYSTQLTSEFPEPRGTFNFWNSLTDTSSYDMIMRENGSITLRNVPVLHASYLSTSMRIADFNETIGQLIGAMKNIKSLLHNSNDFELHFVNSHGPSSTTTLQNLAINLAIKIRTFREPSAEELDDIKMRTVEIIQSINDLEGPITTFAFSNLARKIENEFDVVQSIELIELADDTRQTIEAANTDREDLPMEYVSIRRRPNSTRDEFDPDITLKIN